MNLFVTMAPRIARYGPPPAMMKVGQQLPSRTCRSCETHERLKISRLEISYTYVFPTPNPPGGVRCLDQRIATTLTDRPFVFHHQERNLAIVSDFGNHAIQEGATDDRLSHVLPKGFVNAVRVFAVRCPSRVPTSVDDLIPLVDFSEELSVWPGGGDIIREGLKDGVVGDQWCR